MKITDQSVQTFPDNKVHGAYMGLIWGRQDPGGPHFGPKNLAIRAVSMPTDGEVSDVAKAPFTNIEINND